MIKRVPAENYKLSKLEDEDVISAWKWFLSFISEKDWQKRKANIESKITFNFDSTSPTSGDTVLAVKDDLIGWYLYLLDMIINEPHKYEFFQGARVIPIFQRFGTDLDKLKKIEGIGKRVRDLMRKRPSEADAFLFEILTALLWVRNGYEVAFIDEKSDSKSPDLVAKKDGKIWNIECKRQSKTADYTYRETLKRRKMISLISMELIKRNILLDIKFHVELESLPDTYLKDLLEQELSLAIPGKIVSNEKADIDLSFIDISGIRDHLKNWSVKYNSPMLNSLIGNKPVDNKGFTCSVFAELFRVGEGDVNNVFVSDISNAYGVYWSCDAEETIKAKARDIKSQVNSALQQFNSDHTAVIHVGMETFDGPEVEMARLEKITNTIEKIDPKTNNLQWIFCHFFQAYSPPDQCWVFDETVSSISRIPKEGPPPLKYWRMVVPEDADNADDIYHWERPLP
jgi:hypothetical protein